MMRIIATIGVAALTVCGVAARAQPASGDRAAEGFPLPLDLPPPADTGKPRLFVAPPVTPPPSGCALSFDCRVRVIGAIQRNGAVELNATLLKW
jgi:hypothetical protein